MRSLLTDENVNYELLVGLARRLPELEMLRVRDVGLLQADDPSILSWAAENGVIILTHDRKTMVPLANQRVAAGLPMAGLVLVPWLLPVGRAISDLLIVVNCIGDDEWESVVYHLPL